MTPEQLQQLLANGQEVPSDQAHHAILIAITALANRFDSLEATVESMYQEMTNHVGKVKSAMPKDARGDIADHTHYLHHEHVEEQLTIERERRHGNRRSSDPTPEEAEQIKRRITIDFNFKRDWLPFTLGVVLVGVMSGHGQDIIELFFKAVLK